MLTILIVLNSSIIIKYSKVEIMEDEFEYFQYLHSNPELAESMDLYREVMSCLENDSSEAVKAVKNSIDNTDLLICSIEESDKTLALVEQNILHLLKKIKKKRLEIKPLEDKIRTDKIMLPNMYKLIEATKKRLKQK